MPELVPWSDIYAVQIQRFDAQHKMLFKIINRLNDAMLAGNGHRTMNSVINELIEYMRTSFGDEESAMLKHGYPGYERHWAEHQQFTQSVLDFRQKFIAGKITVSQELLTYLQTWLKQHILRSDRAYSPFLTSKGVH